LRNSSDQKVEATARRELRELYAHGAALNSESALAPIAPPMHPATVWRPPPAPIRAAAAVPPPAVSAPPQVDTIVLIRGNQKTVETFPVETRKHESSK
jgi:hypothetical protein